MHKGNRKICLVTTTIGDGKFLDRYSDNLRGEKLVGDTTIIIIPDKKTPKDLYNKVSLLQKEGIDILCPNLDEQESYLSKLGDIQKIIPYNSDNRRNIGYLMAYEKGCNILISIDDDNYPIPNHGFFRGHLNCFKLNNETKNYEIATSNGWYNICTQLKMNQKNIFPRGFPYYARIQEHKTKIKTNKTPVAINTGLWLKDPDVDAITWLGNPSQVLSFNNESFVLSKDTWSPINTQNTSLIREAIPAYYFIKMGYPIKGLFIDRYGDIFSGFFALKCAKHLGMTARFGSPIVKHIRNTHNYMKDILTEMMCIQILEHFLPELEEVKLTGNSYTEAYLSLSYAIEDICESMEIFKKDKDYLAFFHETAKNMRVWIKTIEILI